MSVRFGNHLVAHYVEHGAAGEGEHRGQNMVVNRSQPVSDPNANHFKGCNRNGNHDGAELAHARNEQRGDNHHLFGNVLDGDSESHGPSVVQVFGIEPDAGRNPFGEFVQGYRHHKKERLVELCVVLVFFGVKSGNGVQMRCYFV